VVARVAICSSPVRTSVSHPSSGISALDVRLDERVPVAQVARPENTTFR
jgi:hypothetical protein